MSTIGLAVGGAKTASNFRENIKNGYMPLENDITYEGLFYDYYFDIGSNANENANATMSCKENELFCPYYVHAIEPNEKSIYLSVGLNSGIMQSSFHRRPLNLVIVLDISGSMNEQLNHYYYDKISQSNKNKQEVYSKLEAAKRAVVGLLKHLNFKKDRFGMALFENQASIYRKLMEIDNKEALEKLQKEILEIKSRGSTNVEAGYLTASQLYDNIKKESDFDNRIIFLTDGMPNTGDTDARSLLGMMRSNSEQSESPIYTTFIGIGVDMNSDLIEKISKMEGCNYYAIHKSENLFTRFDKEFEYMVTPLVFDLQMYLQMDPSLKIEAVYGSPNDNATDSSGKVLYVRTLFASDKNETTQEVKGGIVLVQLKATREWNDQLLEATKIQLIVSYKDHHKNQYENNRQVSLRWIQKQENTYDNLGIRKAILLTKYVQTIKQWIAFERQNSNSERKSNNNWERTSMPLQVSKSQQILIQHMYDYFASEMQIIGDATLQQDLDILQILLNTSISNAPPVVIDATTIHQAQLQMT